MGAQHDLAAADAAVAKEPVLDVDAARGLLLSRTSSGLVHEARNPLNAMAIHLEVLSDKLQGEGGKVPEHLERNVEAARNQARRLDQLLRRWGDLAGGHALDPLPLQKCVERATELAAYALRRGGIGTTVEPNPALEAQVAARSTEVLLALLLHCSERALTGTNLVIAAHYVGVSVCLAITGGGEEAGDDEALELAASSLARACGGELTDSGAGPRWRYVLRLPIETSWTAT